jgi:hypothetical protein
MAFVWTGNITSMVRSRRKQSWHFFQEKLPHIVIYQSYKNRAGVKIKHDYTFEQMYAISSRQEPWEEQIYYEPSKTYQVDGEKSPDLGIGFCNGMGNDFERDLCSSDPLPQRFR